MLTNPLRRYRLLALLPALLFGGAAAGDTLLIEKTLQAPQQALPGRGLSMRQVEARFGPPREIKPPVGNPPITRWVYKDFEVYFEGRHVIHSVSLRP